VKFAELNKKKYKYILGTDEDYQNRFNAVVKSDGGR
jgi:hypothetical protein